MVLVKIGIIFTIMVLNVLASSDFCPVVNPAVKCVNKVDKCKSDDQCGKKRVCCSNGCALVCQALVNVAKTCKSLNRKSNCSFGYDIVKGDDGCPQYNCRVNPCANVTCEKDTQCVVGFKNRERVGVCRQICQFGSPLENLVCGNGTNCTSGYSCTKKRICCPKNPCLAQTCNNSTEICQLDKVVCVKAPCYPVAKCVQSPCATKKCLANQQCVVRAVRCLKKVTCKPSQAVCVRKANVRQ